MLHTDIKPGLLLKLKKEAIERYGENVTCQVYLVTGLKYKPGYKVPYIQCGQLFFKPSDFEKIVGMDYATLHMIQGDYVR